MKTSAEQRGSILSVLRLFVLKMLLARLRIVSGYTGLYLLFHFPEIILGK